MLLFENTHTSAPCYSYTSCRRLAAVMFLGLCSALQLFHLSRNTFAARSSPKTDADEVDFDTDMRFHLISFILSSRHKRKLMRKCERVAQQCVVHCVAHSQAFFSPSFIHPFSAATFISSVTSSSLAIVCLTTASTALRHSAASCCRSSVCGSSTSSSNGPADPTDPSDWICGQNAGEQ